MKKIVKIITSLLMLFMLSGCGEDNAYDGKTGLIGSGGASSSEVASHTKSIYTNVIKADIDRCYSESQELIKIVDELNSSIDAINLRKAQYQFKKTALSYKRVEAIYVAGYNNSDKMYDLAYMIENFIKQPKNYDIKAELDPKFINAVTFLTNPQKGITALEYTLFGASHDLNSSLFVQKRAILAIKMAKNISTRFKSIQDYYENEKIFLKNSDDDIGAMLNVLVQETFQLREFRVGDGAGYTAKFKDKGADARRLEYYKSKNSIKSIKAILKTQKSVMKHGLTAIATLANASSEAEAIVTAIDESLDICNDFSKPLEESLAEAETKELYDSLRILQNNYTALINGLNFKQDIIEADGD